MVREGLLRKPRRSTPHRGAAADVTPGQHERRTRRIAAASAMGLAGLAYVNALNNPFVYDDFGTVLQNPSLQDPSNLLFVLVHSPFRPVVNISYAIDHLLWGPRPFGFHLTNVLLHTAVVGLLFGFILRALQDAARRLRRDAPEPHYTLAAFTGAVLFGVHPILSEAVGYVSGRSEVLCGAFFLSALLTGRAAMLPRETGFSLPGAAGSRPRRVLLALASALFGALAFMSKEVAVALPVVLVAYDWLVLPGTLQARRRRFWLLYVPVFALATVIAANRLSAVIALEATVSTDSPGLTLMTQSIVVWRYLGLIALPTGQSIMHGVHRVTSPADPLAWAAMAGLAGLLAIAFRLRRIDPLITFGVIWFFATLAPSTSVIALREGMAEHRVYLATAGLFVGLAAAARHGLGRLGGATPSFGYTCIVLGLAGVLSVLTLERNNVWGDPVRLWSEALERAPGMWEPHYALGDALREAGACEAAIGEYRKVLAIRPQHRDAHVNLGICLGQTGRLEEAEAEFRRALQIDPSFGRTYTNLAALALLSDEPDRARDLYLKAIAVNRKAVLARMQLARLYESTYGNYADAARLCHEARTIDPRLSGAAECVERNQRRLEGGDQRR